MNQKITSNDSSLISVEKALAIILEKIQPVEAEKISLAERQMKPLKLNLQKIRHPLRISY